MNDIILSAENDIIISTSRLTKAFGNLVAVNDLNLRVMRGDVFGFLGPNGSGKTTTIRMLLGLIRPTAGRAFIFGLDNQYQLPRILRRIGAVVETPVFYPYLSGRDNLRILAAASDMARHPLNDQRIEEVLELVELRAQAGLAYHTYSLGMKQRLGIAAALLTDPELILLDEPTNGLDPVGMVEIRQLIVRLAQQGKTIFLSSHILHEVQQVCNRVAILHRGNLIKQGDVAALLRQSEHILIRMKSSAEAQAALQLLQEAREGGATWIKAVAAAGAGPSEQPGKASEARGEAATTLRVEAPAERSAEINALLARRDLFAAEIHPHEGSLEEAFLELTAAAQFPGASASAFGGLPSPLPPGRSMLGEGKRQ
ncbi:ATP-binding cassette domain-containing protein [Thermogemmatispora carboxidivorans]|uniref:ATP-binding cassette domain-containing protein n=1 Tax=Thermogemmatispora carboxidivorans TaxID=1382306 RepID=UPI000AC1A092|nr:ATP-binding cassette domain-containing protein [Thermogemmatispora carboxidivorans]